jgi:hypothetical protein
MLMAKPHFPALLLAALALSACQSNANKPVDLGIGTPSDVQVTANGQVPAGQDVASAEPGRITDVELRAYCPKVELRDGTNFYRTFEGGASEDPNAIIYQASLGETSRDCRYQDGTLSMTVAVAGRIVPGPKGRDGQINMPIRVAVTQGDTVLYSQLHQHPVQIAASGATQFVFTDRSVSFPTPSTTNVLVFIGYDEGPYDTP